MLGSGNWDSYGTVSTLTDQLVRNERGSHDPLYNESQNPHVTLGWNGPYLDTIPLDPWGNPYVVNIRYANTGLGVHNRHNVMVLSAGPNQLFDTSYSDNTHNEQVSGDDIGYLIRGAEELQ